MCNAQRNNRSRLLLAICALLGVTVLLGVFDMFYVLNNIQDNTIAFVDVFVIVITLLDTLLRIVVIAQGLRLYQTRNLDTSDAVNKCQSIAIASAGLWHELCQHARAQAS